MGRANPRRGHEALLEGRTIVAVVGTILVCGVATAGAAKLIKGSDVKNGSLTGKDVKNQSLSGKDVKNKSLAKGDLKQDVQAMLNSIPIRVTAASAEQGVHGEQRHREQYA